MTGFGRGECSDSFRKITVEIKSVNHRYLDVNIKLPKKLNYLESKVRILLKQYIERGKTDIFINYEDTSELGSSLVYNEGLAKEYLKYFKEMQYNLLIENDITTSSLSKCPEVFEMREGDIDEKAVIELLENAFAKAADNFIKTREDEGTHLFKDLTEKLLKMREYVDFIEERSPEIIAEYRKKIEDKVKELLDNCQIDENRLITEVTIFADKVCVDEEIVRLKSHIESMIKTLENGNAMGRKLDFVAQEMNREANTILSKSNDISISDTAIELKTLIEKVREQIQNIE